MAGLNVSVLIARAIVLLIAFTIHELAHAVAADRLGDDTAKRLGRVSLNPLVHLDPLGTLMLLMAGFGWAKPVPVNPMRLSGNPRSSMALVAAAGPASNLVMAGLAAIPVRLGLVGVATFSTHAILPSLDFLVFEFIWINVILALFNLIPLAPLDGSKVLAGVLPAEWAYSLRRIEQYGPIILLALIFLPSFVPLLPDVIWLLIGRPAQSLTSLLVG